MTLTNRPSSRVRLQINMKAKGEQLLNFSHLWKKILDELNKLHII